MPPPFSFDPWMTDQPMQSRYPTPNAGYRSTSFLHLSTTSTPSTRSSALEDPSSVVSTSRTSLDLGEAELFELTNRLSIPSVDALITFAYQYLIPQTWPIESSKASYAFELVKSYDDIHTMFQDDFYASAYIALLAASKSVVDDDDGLLYDSRVYRGQVMTELRQRVAHKEAQNSVTLKAILKLFSFETIFDNTSIARAHLKALRNLVVTMGGVVLLDSWFREDLLSCDCFFALKCGTRPTFPASDWTPGSLSQPWKARLISAGIFDDHSARIDSLVEHSNLKAIMRDLRELFRAQTYILINEVAADDQLLRWRQLRKFDCISRIADHHVNLTIYPYLYNKPKTQGFTSCAVALIIILILGCPEPVRFGLRMLDQLQAKLIDSESESDVSESGPLRLWACYVGSLTERVHPVASPKRVWFRSKMQRTASQLEVSGWDDMKKILRQFIFSEKLHQEIGQGPKFRQKDFCLGLYGGCGTSWRMPGGECESVE